MSFYLLLSVFLTLSPAVFLSLPQNPGRESTSPYQTVGICLFSTAGSTSAPNPGTPYIPDRYVFLTTMWRWIMSTSILGRGRRGRRRRWVFLSHSPTICIFISLSYYLYIFLSHSPTVFLSHSPVFVSHSTVFSSHSPTIQGEGTVVSEKTAHTSHSIMGLPSDAGIKPYRFQVTLILRDNVDSPRGTQGGQGLSQSQRQSKYRDHWVLRCDTEQELQLWVSCMHEVCASCFRGTD
jgi:hypothetical protein